MCKFILGQAHLVLFSKNFACGALSKEQPANFPNNLYQLGKICNINLLPILSMTMIVWLTLK